MDLSKFTKEQLEELQEALDQATARKGHARRIDWDNMSEQERQNYNKTTQPVTPMVAYAEYPKMIYGKFPDGGYRQARVANRRDEEQIKADHPADWRDSMMAHGVDLTSRPSREIQRIQFLGAPVEDSVSVKADEPQASVPQEHPAAAAARKRGRPPKNAAA